MLEPQQPRIAADLAQLQQGIEHDDAALGEAAFGNIGAGDRQDFTVIGRDVNMAARLEKMCGTLGESVVVSAEFAAALDRPWRRLGEFTFKGFEGARPVYAPG